MGDDEALAYMEELLAAVNPLANGDQIGARAAAVKLFAIVKSRQGQLPASKIGHKAQELEAAILKAAGAATGPNLAQAQAEFREVLDADNTGVKDFVLYQKNARPKP